MHAQRKLMVFAAVLVAGGTPGARAQDVLFTRDYGGESEDGAFAIEATRDGGYIAVGFSRSFSPNSGIAVYLVKTDANGDQEWSRTFDNLSDFHNYGADVKELPGGGYAIAGRTGRNGSFRAFLIRTDANGGLLWERTYDAGRDSRAHALALTSDGGFIIAGQTWFLDGDFGSYDMYVVKTDANGIQQWAQTYEYDDGPNAGSDVALAIEEVSTGGYIIGGFVQGPIWDWWVIRTDELGVAIWDQTHNNGGGSSTLSSIRELADGGFVLAGSFANQSGDSDMALVRTDDLGEPIWTRIFGDGRADDKGQCVRVMPDGGFIFVGMTGSFGAGGADMYIVRTDANGVELWSETDGGVSDDRAWSVAVGTDKIVVGGTAWSFGAGRGDIHLVGYDDPALGCAADLDGDGDADADDFFTYLDLFAADDPAADIDGDGDIDADDFFAYLDLFVTGC